jgi:hypothetical protein
VKRTDSKPLKVFCGYSHRDERYLSNLKSSLTVLRREGLIQDWDDREIVAGREWEEVITANLETSDIILLLVSADFIASYYAYEKEMKRAIERHERGEARAIPIIVRPAYWKRTPLSKLQALLKNAKPITEWSNRDKAWLNVVEGIEKAIRDHADKLRISPSSSADIEEEERHSPADLPEHQQSQQEKIGDYPEPTSIEVGSGGQMQKHTVSVGTDDLGETVTFTAKELGTAEVNGGNGGGGMDLTVYRLPDNTYRVLAEQEGISLLAPSNFVQVFGTNQPAEYGRWTYEEAAADETYGEMFTKFMAQHPEGIKRNVGDLD